MENNLENETLSDEEDQEFEEAFKDITIGAIHDTLKLNNNMKEISFILDKKDESYAKELCNLFKKEYDFDLNYEFKKGICYFSCPKLNQ